MNSSQHNEAAGVKGGAVLDPVCGMTVHHDSAAGSYEHNDETYYFCSRHCLEKFRSDPDTFLAREEVFGPVVSVLRAGDLDEAIGLANSSRYGNSVSLFTQSGAAARTFRQRIQAGMLGINLGVPAPMAFFSFGGWKQSFFGDLHAHGTDAVDFFTRKKTVTSRWFSSGQGSGAYFVER